MPSRPDFRPTWARSSPPLFFGLPIALWMRMQILAVGAYGYGNFGDDCYVDVLKARLPGVELTTLADIEPIDYAPFRYDMTMMAGGGILYDKVDQCGSSSLRYHFRYPGIAQWFDKKSVLLGVGVQGSLPAESIRPYLPILDGMNIRTVRDRHSAERLRELGVQAPILECADLVYALDLVPKPVGLETSRSKPVLGIVASQPGAPLAHAEYPGFDQRTIAALDQLQSRFRFHFFSFDDRRDKWLRAAWKGDAEFTSFVPGQPQAVGRFVEKLRSVDVFATTRYHGVVLSVLLGVPFVGIGAPGQKTHRECDSIEYPLFESYQSEPNAIVAAVEQAWDERVYLQELLAEARWRKQRLALRNFDVWDVERVRPEDSALRMSGEVVEGVNRQDGKTLVVWATDADFWPESRHLLDQLTGFDCLVPSGSGLDHPSAQSRLELPPPGIMAWEAFGTDLQDRLRDAYRNVIVFHGGLRPGKSGHLTEIAARAGRSAWEYCVWPHRIHRIDDQQMKAPRVQIRPESAIAVENGDQAEEIRA